MKEWMFPWICRFSAGVIWCFSHDLGRHMFKPNLVPELFRGLAQTTILVGGLVAIFWIFPYIGLLIIPIDFHIFQRGGPTTNQQFIEATEVAIYHKRTSEPPPNPPSNLTRNSRKRCKIWLNQSQTNWKLRFDLEIWWNLGIIPCFIAWTLFFPQNHVNIHILTGSNRQTPWDFP